MEKNERKKDSKFVSIIFMVCYVEWFTIKFFLKKNLIRHLPSSEKWMELSLFECEARAAQNWSRPTPERCHCQMHTQRNRSALLVSFCLGTLSNTIGKMFCTTDNWLCGNFWHHLRLIGHNNSRTVGGSCNLISLGFVVRKYPPQISEIGKIMD